MAFRKETEEKKETDLSSLALSFKAGEVLRLGKTVSLEFMKFERGKAMIKIIAPRAISVKKLPPLASRPEVS